MSKWKFHPVNECGNIGYVTEIKTKKLTPPRIDWRRKAKSYEGIIKRVQAYHRQCHGLCVECSILNEIDEPDKEGK